MASCLCWGGAEEGERRVVANDPDSNAQYGDNSISNTKYTWYNFILYNLIEQFSRPMNLYFLLIGFLQLNKEITPVDPLTTWIPLLVIFGITAVKEGSDDLGRWRSDREANLRTVRVLRNGEEVVAPSYDIRVGDILKLQGDDEVPCDCVLLSSSAPNGDCFIQTTNLDGESNLKGRFSKEKTRSITTPASAAAFTGGITCKPPDDRLEDFEGVLYGKRADIGDRQKGQGLDASNLLLQATHIRNTDWALALVVYVGNATKFGKNKKPPAPKFTRTDDAINEIVIYIFIFQLVLVAILGVTGNNWKDDYGRDVDYLRYPPASEEPAYQSLIIPARFLLLNSTMIPISLKVTLDLAKLVYSNMIAGDKLLYDEATNSHAIPNSTALSEDLGQIEYVLTDKTGTLTQNVMVLKMITVLGRAADTFGEDDSVMPSADEEAGGGSSGAASGEIESKGMAGTALEGMGRTPLLSNQVAARSRREAEDDTTSSSVLEMLRNMSLNNDVRPEPKAGGDGASEGGAAALSMPTGTGKLCRLEDIPVKYKASSPDEEAFLKGSARLGVALLARDGGTDEQTVTVQEPIGRRQYTQVAVFPFDSDRKRMSVLVRMPPPAPGALGQSRLYVKGADDMLLNTKPEDVMIARG